MCTEDARPRAIGVHRAADTHKCALYGIKGTSHRGRQEGGNTRPRLKCGDAAEGICVLIHCIRAVTSVNVDVQKSGSNIRTCRINHRFGICRAKLCRRQDVRDAFIIAEDKTLLRGKMSVRVRQDENAVLDGSHFVSLDSRSSAPASRSTMSVTCGCS